MSKPSGRVKEFSPQLELASPLIMARTARTSIAPVISSVTSTQITAIWIQTHLVTSQVLFTPFLLAIKLQIRRRRSKEESEQGGMK